MNKNSQSKQDGLYTVEFAIVGSLFFLLFFACIEIGRLFFTWNVLTEVSRRGARLATVCNALSDTSDASSVNELLGVTQLATFSGIQIIPNLTTDNIEITYLELDGSEAGSLSDIRLVRAEIVNYQHELLIPGLYLTLNSPTFKTTLVSESLGAIPGGNYTVCS
ncbi:TadE/TadG family type IV pilus assembly protein [Thalassomonas sp. M1454]|uniref:TadE/TadG family type IV pilus assembly protein n=1 Tax=Thalassomonas sp. M1454 TaxID=2594477 RepID=UPI00117C0EC4|nr:TadE family protein [Thalassomonas sp. M1454]TRX54440.1 pilus assembly protein [Thalassomonas sp. M1454]